MLEFGESIMFLHAKSAGKDKFDSRWDDGIWLGIREESGEHIIGTRDGVLKTRSIRCQFIPTSLTCLLPVEPRVFGS